MVSAVGGAYGGSSSSGPSTPPLGDGESCTSGGRCVKRGPTGVNSSQDRAHQPRGTGSPAQAVVGAQGGACGGLQPPRPRHTSRGGQGVLPRRCSVHPEGPLRGAGVSKARAHQPGGTRSPALAVVGASSRACQGGSKVQSLGTPVLGVLPWRWSVRREGPARGATIFKAEAHQPGGTGVLPWCWSVCPEEPARSLQSSRPGHTSRGGQVVPPRRWSLRPEGAVRGAALFKARAHHPGGTGSRAQAVVGAS